MDDNMNDNMNNMDNTENENESVDQSFGSSEYYKKLYFYKEKSNKATKNFSYSIFIKDYTIENTEFIVNDRVTMYLSTPDLEFGLKIYNGFVKKKQYKYKEYELKKIRVDLVKEKKITKEQVIFKTLSPASSVS